MMARDEVPRDAQISSILPDRTALFRRLDRDGRVHDIAPLFDLNGLDVEIPEDIRDELVGLFRILDDVDVLVHQAFQLRDVLAFLADRLPDVAFLDDEDEFVARVDAVHDRRPREILEERDVPDRLLVENDLGHANPRRSGYSIPPVPLRWHERGSGRRLWRAVLRRRRRGHQPRGIEYPDRLGFAWPRSFSTSRRSGTSRSFKISRGRRSWTASTRATSSSSSSRKATSGRRSARKARTSRS